jgi:Ca2+-binding EF-hand superfamily protein
MQRKENQHHGDQNDKTTGGHAQPGPGHEQKLHEDAYQTKGHPVDAKAQHERDEKLKVEHAQELMASFKRKDVNHDGKLTVDEVVNYDRAQVKEAMASYTKSVSKSDMAALDLNHDGAITLKEYETARASSHLSPKQIESEFKARNANGDGHISFSEIENFDTKRSEGFQKDVLKAVNRYAMSLGSTSAPVARPCGRTLTHYFHQSLESNERLPTSICLRETFPGRRHPSVGTSRRDFLEYC